MRIFDRFRRMFVLPLFLGIILSIILTITLLVLYTMSFSTNKKAVDLFKYAQGNITTPIIQTTKNKLYVRFQESILALEILASYYDFYVNHNSYNKTFINLNADNILNFPSSREIDNYWFLDDIAKNIDDVSNANTRNPELFKKQLYSLTKLNLISHVLSQQMTGLNEFFYGFGETGLYYSSIINKTSRSSDFYKKFLNFQNPTTCQQNDRLKNIFNFTCTDWYKSLSNIKDNSNRTIRIMNPYAIKKSNSSTYGIQICLKFTDILSSGDNFGVVCSDIDYSDLINDLDGFNKRLSGYFYILQVGSPYPVYYPMINKIPYYSQIKRFEFDMNSSFYIEELNGFENILPNLTMKYNFDPTNFPTKDNYQIQYFKNENVTCQIFPVRLNTFLWNPNITDHIFSIIYVSKPSIYNDLKEYQDKLTPKLIIQSILFVIMSLILILLTRYLILSIATNIVKPIKNLKNLVKGMSESKNQIQHKENDLDFNDETRNEEEEEILEARSEEIEYLFNILLRLKNILFFTSNTKNSEEPQALIKYVNGKYTFRTVNNSKGMNLCDSNVGNLSMKFKKYDKAIFHLQESMKEHLDIVKEVERKTVSKKSQIFTKFINIFDRTKSLKQVNKIEQKPLLKTNDDYIKSVYLESRYPKLIFAYKKFFNHLNKALVSSEFFNEITQKDIFAYSSRHQLESYEKALNDYLSLANSSNDLKKIIEVETEIIDFHIKYNLKPCDNEDEKEEIKKLINEQKKNQLLEIIMKFKILQKKIDAYKSNSSPEILKNFIDLVKNSRKENIRNIDTPMIILIQRLNYLKGKLFKICGHYKKAIDYFIKSKELTIVCDARIVRKSIEKILEILQIIDQIEIIKTKKEKVVTNDDQFNLKKEINLYSHSLKNELEAFNGVHKDLVVLIDLSESMQINEWKNFKNVLKVVQNIFDSYISMEDRFGFFLDSGSVNTIVTLVEKTVNSYSYVKAVIENLSTEIEKNEELRKTHIHNSILHVSRYLEQKSPAEKEKILVIFTDDCENKKLISLFQNDKFRMNSIENKMYYIVVGMSSVKKFHYLERIMALEKTKNCYLDFESVGKLRNILKITGKIEDNIRFQNEKYDAERKY